MARLATLAAPKPKKGCSAAEGLNGPEKKEKKKKGKKKKKAKKSKHRLLSMVQTRREEEAGKKSEEEADVKEDEDVGRCTREADDCQLPEAAAGDQAAEDD